MHLASTTSENATAPERRPALRRITDRPAVPGILFFLAALAAIEGRLVLLDHRDITELLRVGSVYGHPGQVPRGVHVFQYTGYDGQFYYRMALDPANLHTTAFGITMDAPYRFMRIGYSALAWLVSLGQHAAVPYALVAINVAALGALAYLGGILAQEAGRHALWGLLLAGYFGLMDSLSRDLTEPLGALCLIAGILAYRKRHPLLAAAAFGYGVLTRETVLIVPAVLGVTRIIQIARRRARPGADDLAWIVPAVVFAGWELVVKAATGVFPILSDSGKNAGLPFSAAFSAIAHNFAHPAYAGTGRRARSSSGTSSSPCWRCSRWPRCSRCGPPPSRSTSGPRVRGVPGGGLLPGPHQLGRLRRPAGLRGGLPAGRADPAGAPRRRLASLGPLAACAASLVILVALYRTQIS